MSRHYFDTVHKGFPITVVLGWDRPANYFFLFIEKPAELIDDTAKVESDDFLYSNLHESDPFNHYAEIHTGRKTWGQFGLTVAIGAVLLVIGIWLLTEATGIL